MATLTLDSIENIILDLVFRGNAGNFQPPTQLYFGLLGANGVEISGGNYARVSVASTTANWKLGSDDGGFNIYGASNAAYIRWPNLGLNVTITGIAIYTANTGGVMIFASKIISEYSATTADAYGPQIYANDLAITFYGQGENNFPFTQYLTSRLVEYIFMGNLSGWTPPETLYLGLITGYVTAFDYTEVSSIGTGYTRIAMPSNATTWKSTQGNNASISNGVNGIIKNSARIDWPTVTGTYGLVEFIGLFESPNAGNLLWVTPLLNSTRIDLGDEPPYILAENLQVSAMSVPVVI